jgi:hypothetical protein
MSGPTELLVLRLGLIALIFVFVAVVAVSLNSSIPARAGASRPAPRPSARLVVLRPGESGLAQGTQFALAGLMVVGRDPGAGIIIGDSSVSTRHATIERVDGHWHVTDLGSTNGTFVDGKPVGSQGATARPNSRLTVGNVVLELRTD